MRCVSWIYMCICSVCSHVLVCSAATWLRPWPWTRRPTAACGSSRSVTTWIWRWCWWSTRAITTSSFRSIPNSPGGRQRQVRKDAKLWDWEILREVKPHVFCFSVKATTDLEEAVEWKSESLRPVFHIQMKKQNQKALLTHSGCKTW